MIERGEVVRRGALGGGWCGVLLDRKGVDKIAVSGVKAGCHLPTHHLMFGSTSLLNVFYNLVKGKIGICFYSEGPRFRSTKIFILYKCLPLINSAEACRVWHSVCSICLAQRVLASGATRAAGFYNVILWQILWPPPSLWQLPTPRYTTRL